MRSLLVWDVEQMRGERCVALFFGGCVCVCVLVYMYFSGEKKKSQHIKMQEM